MLSTWKTRPKLARATFVALLDDKGQEIVTDKPHDLLLATPKVPTLQEQVQNLTKLGAIRRTSMLDNLPEDYYAEDIEDDINDVGMTIHELEGQKKYWKDDLPHKTPADVNPVIPSSSPSGQKPEPLPTE